MMGFFFAAFSLWALEIRNANLCYLLSWAALNFSFWAWECREFFVTIWYSLRSKKIHSTTTILILEKKIILPFDTR